jgi:hypothetical protein
MNRQCDAKLNDNESVTISDNDNAQNKEIDDNGRQQQRQDNMTN